MVIDFYANLLVAVFFLFLLELISQEDIAFAVAKSVILNIRHNSQMLPLAPKNKRPRAFLLM